MRRPSFVLLSLLTLAGAGADTYACDSATGERIQRAYFSWGAESLGSRKGDVDSMWVTELPTGQKLALQVSEPTDDTYIEASGGRKHNAELVWVEVFDVTTTPYTRVFASLAGANASSSIPSAELPSEVLSNLRVNLSKPVCVSVGSFATSLPEDGRFTSSIKD